jgi:hypothetical protein
VTIPVTATSARTTANLTLQATHTTAFTLTGLATSKTGQTCTATGCTFTFNVTFTRTLPAGQVLPDVVNFNITATDISVVPNLVSTPVSASVSVKPRPDTITVVPPVEYRSGLKQRLIITATSSVVSPNVVLTLQPYACQVNAAPCVPNAAGVWMYDPAQLGANLVNNGNGNYATTLVGAPQPACDAANTTPCSLSPLDIKSNLGGDSGFFALTRIR